MQDDTQAEIPTLTISALGPLRLRVAQKQMEGGIPAKAAAIVVYLADCRDRVPRTKLAGLLWSDHTESRARSNLRIALSRLRKELGAWVDADRESVWLTGSLNYDAHRISELSADELLAAYRGEFLQGFEVEGAALFDEWLTGRRATLHARAIEQLSEHARLAREVSNWMQCRRLATRLTKLEPWDEHAHRWLLESIFAVAGQATALASYDRFAEQLHKELGVEPEVATRELAASIREQPQPFPKLEQGDLLAACIPTWPTPLLGRTQELETVISTIRPGRPLSIVGIGGVGKSRLLAAFAERRKQAGRAVLHVGFEGHARTSGEATTRVFSETVLAAMGVPADSESSSQDTVRRSLQQWAGTLCLDNLEQLDDVEQTIGKLASECPSLEIALTSRRRLVLVSGSVVELHGLACGTHHHGDGSVAPAVALFLDRLSRSPQTNEEWSMIEQVCSSVSGHPLAIELAAHWASTASLFELAEVLETDGSFSTTAQDLPARHRGLDVLVALSTERLGTTSLQVLRAAAFFSSPFHRSDLEALVPIHNGELEELVSHSLLGVEAERYSIHPVVKRFAETKLEASGSAEQLHAAHARLFVRRLLQNTGDLADSDSSMRSRSQDLRRAIAWTIEHAKNDELLVPLRRYLGHLRAWGWVRTGLETIATALEREDLEPVVTAELHRHAAEAMLHAGRLDGATEALEHGLRLVGDTIPEGSAKRWFWNLRQSTALSIAPLVSGSETVRRCAAERARLMTLLGELFYVSERRAEMTSYGLGSLAAGRASREPVLIAAGDAGLAVASQLAGAHPVANRCRERARHRMRTNASTDLFTATQTWAMTALVAAGAGRWMDARADCEAAMRAGFASGRTRFVSQIRILLALIDHHQGQHRDALLRLRDVEETIEQNGFRRSLTWVHATRAEVALAMNDHILAREAAECALSSAIKYDRPEDAARARVLLARLELENAQPEKASSLLSQALPGLAAPSAVAFQHFESHCGAADVALSLSEQAGIATTDARTILASLKSYARAFPIATPHHRHLLRSHAVY